MATIREFLKLFSDYLNSEVQSSDSGSALWAELKDLEVLGWETEITNTPYFKHRLMRILIALQAQAHLSYFKLTELSAEKLQKESTKEAKATEQQACELVVAEYQKFLKERQQDFEKLVSVICGSAHADHFKSTEELLDLEAKSDVPLKLLDNEKRLLIANKCESLKKLAAEHKVDSDQIEKIVSAVENFNNNSSHFSDKPLEDQRIIDKVADLIALLDRFSDFIVKKKAIEAKKQEELYQGIAQTVARHSGKILNDKLKKEQLKYDAFVKTHAAFIPFLANFLGVPLTSVTTQIREAAVELAAVTQPQLSSAITTDTLDLPKTQSLMLEAGSSFTQSDQSFEERMKTKIQVLKDQIASFSPPETKKALETKASEAKELSLVPLKPLAKTSTLSSADILRHASHKILQIEQKVERTSLTDTPKTSPQICDPKGSPYLREKIKKFCQINAIPEDVVFTISSGNGFTDISAPHPYNQMLALFLEQALSPQTKVQLQLRRGILPIIQQLLFRNGEIPDRVAMSTTGYYGTEIRSGLFLDEENAAPDEVSAQQALRNIVATVYELYMQSCNVLPQQEHVETKASTHSKSKEQKNVAGKYDDLEKVEDLLARTIGISIQESEKSTGSTQKLYRIVAIEEQIVNFCKQLLKANPKMAAALEPLLKYDLILSIQDDFLKQCKIRELNNSISHTTRLYRHKEQVLCSIDIEVVEQNKKVAHIVQVVDRANKSENNSYAGVLEAAKSLKGQSNTLYSLVIFDSEVRVVMSRCPVDSPAFISQMEALIKEIENEQKAQEAQADNTSKLNATIKIPTQSPVKLREGMKAGWELIKSNEIVHMMTVVSAAPYGENLEHAEYSPVLQRDFEGICKKNNISPQNVIHLGIVYREYRYASEYLAKFWNDLFTSMQAYMNRKGGYFKAAGKSDITVRIKANIQDNVQPDKNIAVLVRADGNKYLELDPICAVDTQSLLFEFDLSTSNIQVVIGNNSVLNIQTPKSLSDLPLPPPSLVKKYDELVGTNLLRLHGVRVTVPDTVSSNHDLIRELATETKQNGEEKIAGFIDKFAPPAEDSSGTRVVTLERNGSITAAFNASAEVGRMGYRSSFMEHDRVPLITIPRTSDPSALEPSLFMPVFQKYHPDLYDWLIANAIQIRAIILASWRLPFPKEASTEERTKQKLAFIQQELEKNSLTKLNDIADLFKTDLVQFLSYIFDSIVKNHLAPYFFSLSTTKIKYYNLIRPLLDFLLGSLNRTSNEIDANAIEAFIKMHKVGDNHPLSLYSDQVVPFLQTLCKQLKLPATWDAIALILDMTRYNFQPPVKFQAQSFSLDSQKLTEDVSACEVMYTAIGNEPVAFTPPEILPPAFLLPGRTVSEVQTNISNFATALLQAAQKKYQQLFAFRQQRLKLLDETTQRLTYIEKRLEEKRGELEKLGAYVYFYDKERKIPTLNGTYQLGTKESQSLVQQKFDEYKAILKFSQEFSKEVETLKKFVNITLPKKMELLQSESQHLVTELLKIGGSCELSAYQIRLIARHLRKFNLACDLPDFDKYLQVLPTPKLILAAHSTFTFELITFDITEQKAEAKDVKEEKTEIKGIMPPKVEEKTTQGELFAGAQWVLAQSGQTGADKNRFTVKLGVAKTGEVSLEITPITEEIKGETLRFTS